ncbi:MAG: zinc ABC transporter substrate-binding protein [Candidatus Sedimenticola endophacoides]
MIYRLLLTLALVLLLSLVGAHRAAAAPRVFVSIPPQQYLVEGIAGDLLEVEVMVGPGQNPATYEPLPRQMARLSGALLYYRIGVPFERVWMKRMLANNPSLEALDARQGLALRAIEAHGHAEKDDDDHGHPDDHGQDDHGHPGGDDPHIWLSPRRMARMSDLLLERLVRLAPGHEAVMRANHHALRGRLEALDRELQTLLAPLRGRAFLVYHPSWGYFADDYGLHQVPIEAGGREPGARALVGLIEQARAERVRSIFVQRQFAQDQARALADAVGARLVVIDPLSGAYVENLRQAARAIAEGVE